MDLEEKMRRGEASGAARMWSSSETDCIPLHTTRRAVEGRTETQQGGGQPAGPLGGLGFPIQLPPGGSSSLKPAPPNQASPGIRIFKCQVNDNAYVRECTNDEYGDTGIQRFKATNK